MHSQHVMIDIETLSTENDAAIIAIGAVEFDLDNILQKKMWLINPKLASGRRETSTLEWWASQDRSVFQTVWSGFERENIIAAELFNWAVPFRETHWIWGDPSTFDLPILKTWYRNQGMIYPFNWRNERDGNTLEKLADQLGIYYQSMDVPGRAAHNPLEDCLHQAHRCQFILRALAGQFDTRDLGA